jgi:hypothetical protein
MRRILRSTPAVLNYYTCRDSLIRVSALATAAAISVAVAIRPLPAQGVGVGASLTPYVGYLVTGKWYDGPGGSSLATANSPMAGVQVGVPLTSGVSLVGNLAYSSGDLRVGLPLLGGVNVGTNRMWLYDAGLEIGGLAHKRTGVAPYLLGGVGGVTNDIRNALFTTRTSNLMYSAGVGIDLGLSSAMALRVQAKDYVGRFDSQEAVGFRAEGNLAHNWAFSAGVKLAF